MKHRHVWTYHRVEIRWKHRPAIGRPTEGIEKRCACGASAWCLPDRWPRTYPRRPKVFPAGIPPLTVVPAEASDPTLTESDP